MVGLAGVSEDTVGGDVSDVEVHQGHLASGELDGLSGGDDRAVSGPLVDCDAAVSDGEDSDGLLDLGTEDVHDVSDVGDRGQVDVVALDDVLDELGELEADSVDEVIHHIAVGGDDVAGACPEHGGIRVLEKSVGDHVLDLVGCIGPIVYDVGCIRCRVVDIEVVRHHGVGRDVLGVQVAVLLDDSVELSEGNGHSVADNVDVTEVVGGIEHDDLRFGVRGEDVLHVVVEAGIVDGDRIRGRTDNSGQGIEDLFGLRGADSCLLHELDDVSGDELPGVVHHLHELGVVEQVELLLRDLSIDDSLDHLQVGVGEVRVELVCDDVRLLDGVLVVLAESGQRLLVSGDVEVLQRTGVAVKSDEGYGDDFVDGDGITIESILEHIPQVEAAGSTDRKLAVIDIVSLRLEELCKERGVVVFEFDLETIVVISVFGIILCHPVTVDRRISESDVVQSPFGLVRRVPVGGSQQRGVRCKHYEYSEYCH